MSRIIASAAIRGAQKIVSRAEKALKEATEKFGPEQVVEFPNTGYFLPVIYAMTGMEVRTIADMHPVLDKAKMLLPPVPAEKMWLPYLGNALDAGMATLFADEIIEVLKYLEDPVPYHIAENCPDEGDDYWLGAADDLIFRKRGLEFVDGTAPGFAAIVGCAPNNEIAVRIARELQEKNLYVFMTATTDGKNMAEQLRQEGVQLGWETRLVPFGKDITATVFPLGFAARVAMSFGGVQPGDYWRNLLYNKNRTFAFVIALGEVDDEKYAQAAGAINYGFPTIADTDIPEILPTGICTYEHVVAMPKQFPPEEIYEKIVAKAIEVRGLKVEIHEVPIPVSYGPAFEGEVIRRDDMYVEFGGQRTPSFEYLRMLENSDDVTDGKIELFGPEIDDIEAGSQLPLGVVVEVYGREMQEEFEAILERMIHTYINGASGAWHNGQRDINWLRISNDAKEQGFKIKHFGDIIHARLHQEYGAVVDRVQVRIYTTEEDVLRLREEARKAYHQRDERIAGMTDESVDTYYSCILCVPAGQDIVLSDGSFKPVEKLIEDSAEVSNINVLSFNYNPLAPFSKGDENRFEAKAVEETFINPAPSRLSKIVLSNGNSLVLTGNHKVLVDKMEGLEWIKAAELQPDDRLISTSTISLNGYNTGGISKPFIIDYLPDDIKVFDDEFIDKLGQQVLEKYGTWAEAARELGFDYGRFYGIFHANEKFSRPRLKLGELKHICANVDMNWDDVKSEINVFGISNGCKLQKQFIDEDLMYAAGLVASGGCVRRRGNGSVLQFTNAERALTDIFNQIITATFNIEPRMYITETSTSRSDNDVNVSIANSQIAGRLMLGLGIGKKWTGEIISTFSPHLVASFLRGLFDGGGHATDSHIMITTRSYKESQHTMLLLKKLSISSYISEITRGFQVGTRSYHDYIRFRKLISSEHPQKRVKMEMARFNFDVNHVSRTDVLPQKCGKLLEELLQDEASNVKISKLPVDRKSVRAWIDGQCRASKEKMRLVLDHLLDKVNITHPAFVELSQWCDSTITIEKVKSIEEIENKDRRVYNFSVQDTHNYLVQGIVVKNCQSFAPTHVCAITPERSGLCGGYSWLDARANYQIIPTGPNQPIPKGDVIDEKLGQWTGVNEYIAQASRGALTSFSAYSMIVDPMTSCVVGDTELIINGEAVKASEFIDRHHGSDSYVGSSALTLHEGKAEHEPIVALQRFKAPDNLIQINTKSGTKLALTPNHEIAVDRLNASPLYQRGVRGDLQWIRADQINVGDRLLSLRNLELPSNSVEIVDILPDDFRVADEDLLADIKQQLTAKYDSLRQAVNQVPIQSPVGVKSMSLKDLKTAISHLGLDWDTWKKNIRIVGHGASFVQIPDELDAELFYMVGLIASDGSITKRGRYEYHIDFVNTDEALGQEFTTIYTHLFPGRKLSVAVKSEEPSTIDGRVVKPTKLCRHYYANNPVLGVICEHFGIQIGKKGEWHLGKMVNLPKEYIASFIAGLFDGDGSVRIRNYADKWDVAEGYLCISDESAARHLQLLLKRLGIVGNVRKSDAVWKVEMHGSNLSTFAAVIPSKHPQKRALLKDVRQLSNIDKLDKTEANVLRAALEADYFLDIVTDVKVIKNNGEYDYVYNLTLADTHCYFANGALIKNCGCFECISAILPLTNGVMIVNREFIDMTPCGMRFSTLAGTVGGGLQTPGFVGHSRRYIASPKYILGDGGFKRIVWMTKELKEDIGPMLEERAKEEGIEGFLDMIADETIATTEDEVLEHLMKVGHPALEMEPMI